MSNMSYCRFQNTLGDLKDCAENLHVAVSREEASARAALIELAREIAESCEEIDDLRDLGSAKDPAAERECESCEARLQLGEVCENCGEEDEETSARSLRLPQDWCCPSCRTEVARVAPGGLVTCENGHRDQLANPA